MSTNIDHDNSIITYNGETKQLSIVPAWTGDAPDEYKYRITIVPLDTLSGVAQSGLLKQATVRVVNPMTGEILAETETDENGRWSITGDFPDVSKLVVENGIDISTGKTNKIALSSVVDKATKTEDIAINPITSVIAAEVTSVKQQNIADYKVLHKKAINKLSTALQIPIEELEKDYIKEDNDTLNKNSVRFASSIKVLNEMSTDKDSTEAVDNAFYALGKTITNNMVATIEQDTDEVIVTKNINFIETDLTNDSQLETLVTEFKTVEDNRLSQSNSNISNAALQKASENIKVVNDIINKVQTESSTDNIKELAKIKKIVDERVLNADESMTVPDMQTHINNENINEDKIRHSTYAPPTMTFVDIEQQTTITLDRKLNGSLYQYVEPLPTDVVHATDSNGHMLAIERVGVEIDENLAVGRYSIVYKAKDQNTNDTASKTIIYDIVDTGRPSITVQEQYILLNVGDSWQPQVTCLESDGTAGTCFIEGTYDLSTVGKYTITHVSNTDNTVRVSQYITVRHSSKPTMEAGQDDTLINSTLKRMYKRVDLPLDADILPIARDSTNAQLEVNVSGRQQILNAKTDGNYTLTYEAIDSSLQSVTVTRIVTVWKIPTLTLNDKNPLFWNKGQSYVDPGFTSSKNGIRTNSSNIDVDKLGDYVVYYTYTGPDSKKVILARRTVQVRELIKVIQPNYTPSGTNYEEYGAKTFDNSAYTTQIRLVKSDKTEEDVSSIQDMQVSKTYRITYTMNSTEASASRLVTIINSSSPPPSFYIKSQDSTAVLKTYDEDTYNITQLFAKDEAGNGLTFQVIKVTDINERGDFLTHFECIEDQLRYKNENTVSVNGFIVSVRVFEKDNNDMFDDAIVRIPNVKTKTNVSMSVDNKYITELGGVTTITATLDHTAGQDTVIEVEYENGEQFTLSDTTITIPANSIQASITITAHATVGYDKIVRLNLTTSTAELVDNQVVVTIATKQLYIELNGLPTVSIVQNASNPYIESGAFYEFSSSKKNVRNIQYSRLTLNNSSDTVVTWTSAVLNDTKIHDLGSAAYISNITQDSSYDVHVSYNNMHWMEVTTFPIYARYVKFTANRDKDFSFTITTTQFTAQDVNEDFDTTYVGVYRATYTFKDFIKRTYLAYRLIIVKVGLTLIGGNKILGKDVEYVDEGVTATDNNAVILTTIRNSQDVLVSNDFINTIDTYKVTYTCDNGIPVTRTVTVRARPLITGVADTTIFINTKVNLRKGVTSTGKITIEGTLDTSTLGQYTVTYNSVDKDGITALPVERVIKVVPAVVKFNEPIQIEQMEKSQWSIVLTDLLEVPVYDITWNFQGDHDGFSIDKNTLQLSEIGSPTTAKIYGIRNNGSKIGYLNVLLTITGENVSTSVGVSSIESMISLAPPRMNLDATGKTIYARLNEAMDEDITVPLTTLNPENSNLNVDNIVILKGQTEGSTVLSATKLLSDKQDEQIIIDVNNIPPNTEISPYKNKIYVRIVADTVPPVITLKGTTNVDIPFGQSYVDEGVSATDNSGKEFTFPDDFTITGSFNTSSTGKQSITYSATDVAGNTSTVTRTVTVVNISLIPFERIIEQNTLFDDPGATMTNGSEVRITKYERKNGDAEYSEVENFTTKDGNYTYRITYTSTQFPSLQVQRILFIEQSDVQVVSEPPKIILMNELEISWKEQLNLTATAFDANDNNITANITSTVTSNAFSGIENFQKGNMPVIDTAHIGTYTVTYTVEDVLQQTTSAVQIVRVKPKLTYKQKLYRTSYTNINEWELNLNTFVEGGFNLDWGIQEGQNSGIILTNNTLFGEKNYFPNTDNEFRLRTIKLIGTKYGVSSEALTINLRVTGAIPPRLSITNVTFSIVGQSTIIVGQNDDFRDEGANMTVFYDNETSETINIQSNTIVNTSIIGNNTLNYLATKKNGAKYLSLLRTVEVIPNVLFNISQTRISKSGGTSIVKATLSSPIDEDVSITVAANAVGVDYSLSSQTLIIASGETISNDMTITLNEETNSKVLRLTMSTANEKIKFSPTLDIVLSTIPVFDNEVTTSVAAIDTWSIDLNDLLKDKIDGIQWSFKSGTTHDGLVISAGIVSATAPYTEGETRTASIVGTTVQNLTTSDLNLQIVLSEPEVKLEDVVTGIGNGEVSIDLGQYGFGTYEVYGTPLNTNGTIAGAEIKIGTEIKNTRSD